MTIQTALARVMAGLRDGQSLDQLQNLTLFANGTGMAVFAGCTITFESFDQLERLVTLIESRQQPKEPNDNREQPANAA